MRLSGTVKSVRIDQEKHGVVLRVVVESENDLLPIQMRGQVIDGILEAGDRVTVKRSSKRGRDGVIRPKEISNQTTNSIVRVKRRTLIARFFGFVLSITVSVGSAVGSAVISKEILDNLSPTTVMAPRSGGGHVASSHNEIVGWIIGATIGLIVFYLIYLRRKR